jgi:hypothetical protein
MNNRGVFLTMKNESIIKAPRRGLMNDKPQGSACIPEVKGRVRRINAVTCAEEQHANNRQMRLPGF